LGSYGVGAASFPDEQEAGGDGFLDMLRNQWSPKKLSHKRTTPPPPYGKQPGVVNANQLHRKNEAYLNQNRQLPQSQPSPSPSPQIHRRAGSASQDDRPPASRGTRKRLTSINNDDWEKEEQKSGAEESLSPSEESDDEQGFGSSAHPDERTSLLPPTGISTNEQDGKRPSEETRKRRRGKKVHRVHRQVGVVPPPDQASTVRADNRATAAAFYEQSQNQQPQNQVGSKVSVAMQC
jgi:hypothetical protein